jgi:biopolymer transport protein ExbB
MDLTKSLLALAIGGSTGVLWLLMGLSLASVAIMIERGLTFYQSRFNAEKFFAEIEPLLQEGDWSEAISCCEAEKAVEPQILRAGLLQVHNGMGAVQEAMNSERTHKGLYLGQRLSFLGTLGANAPFIGLLGTVLGIIHAFKDLSLTEGGGGLRLWRASLRPWWLLPWGCWWPSPPC